MSPDYIQTQCMAGRPSRGVYYNAIQGTFRVTARLRGRVLEHLFVSELGGTGKLIHCNSTPTIPVALYNISKDAKFLLKNAVGETTDVLEFVKVLVVKSFTPMS